MLKFKLCLLSLMIIGFSGCVQNSVNSTQDNNFTASFIVDEVTGSLSISDETALPEKFTLQLNACIRSHGKIETKLPSTHWVISNDKKALDRLDSDTSQQKKIPKSTNLDNKQNTIIQMTTDGNGCINWTEEYDYAYTKQSKWIVIDRYIKGISNEYPGISRIPLAINPWLQLNRYSNIQIADYRENYHLNNNNLKDRVNENGLEFLKQQKKIEQKHKVNIIIDELDLHADGSDSKDNKRILRGNIIKAKLKYSIKDIHGNLRDSQLNQGHFEIKPYLLISVKQLLENGQTKIEYIKMNENNASSLIDTRFENNLLTSLPFNWIIPFESYNSRIALYLKVIPKGATAKRINSFEGIYFIGENFRTIVSGNKKNLHLNSILGEKYRSRILHNSNNHLSVSSSLSTASLSDYNHPNECLKVIQTSTQSIESCISNKKTNGLMNGFGQAGWTIEKMNIRFFQMEKEHWLSRKISTIVETSIYDPLQSQRISHHSIDIEVIDLSTGKKEKIEKITELNGNISFNISTKQNWYKRQRYFLKIIRFLTKTKELKMEKIIAINPWDYGFTHGFEVGHSTNNKTTCLEKTDKEEMKLLFLNQKLDNLTDKQIHTIHNLFCYDPLNIPDSSTQSEETINWADIFNTFRTTLKIILRKTTITADKEFYAKFKSSKTVKRPTAQIHLFRAINKYPTYLIDNSLNREIFYNLRFKLTPRTVRHDDIAIGQQNKGPIRDGIYVFQMAVLKNDQGKFNGHKAMVQPRDAFSLNATDVNKAGTIPLFNCLKDIPNCVIKEDFIIPPTDIPIVIRDGMMKTDIRTLIRREHLLFANSKNILVFRILPADPASVICKDQTKECLMDEPESVDSYEMALDWKETIKNIKPASPHYYDIFFYTYKAPFIPSLWANWNITHELDLSFSDLQKIYSSLSDADIKQHTESKDNTVKLSDMEDIHLTVSQPDRVRQQQATEDNKNLKLLIEEQQDILKSLSDLAETADEDTKQAFKDEIKKTRENINLIARNIIQNNIVAETPELTPMPETNTPTVTPYILTENVSAKPEPVPHTPKDLNYCSGATIGNTEYLTYPDNTEQCSIDKTEKDLSQKHIFQFASTHALCTININADTPLQTSSKNCGYFNSVEKAQQSFLDDLNKQIQTINSIKKEIHSFERSLPYGPIALETTQNNTLKSNQNTKEKNTPPSMEESFQRNHYNSLAFKNKLKNMPELPLLNGDDLEEIIQSDINNISIKNEKTGAFLHALCGFWFSEFLSSKYTTADLLLDGFRKSIKKTFYYKLRGIPLFSEEDINHTVQNLNQGLKELETLYENHLTKNNLKGVIDDVHKWVNNEPEYEFDSLFHQSLYDQFHALSQTALLNNDKPSWERPGWLLSFFKSEDKEQVNNKFNAANYLTEAIEAVKTIEVRHGVIRRSKDLHPFRKCISNPSHFFGFEKKIIVGEIDNNLKYGDLKGAGGEKTTLNISEDFLMNTQRDQGSNQGFDTDIGSTLSLLTIPITLLTGFTGGLIFKAATSLFTKMSLVSSVTLISLGSMMGSARYSYRSYEGTGKRRLFSIRVSEGVELISEHTPMIIPLKKYNECLVIRPRFSAFESHIEKYDHIWNTGNKMVRSIYENIGVLLCSPGRKPNYAIHETFYYIYPNYPINGITLDPSSHRNKPFVISLRGQLEYKKFIHNLSCYVSENTTQLKNNMDCRDSRGHYEHLLSKHIEFADNLKQGFYIPKMFHLTGDSPGIYSPPIEEQERDIKANQSTLQKVFNWFSDRQFMDADIEKLVRREPK